MTPFFLYKYKYGLFILLFLTLLLPSFGFTQGITPLPSLDRSYRGGGTVTVDISNVVWNMTSTYDFLVQDDGTTFFRIIDTGDIEIPLDDAEIRFGTGSDAYITFDGDSLNIVANNVTATDDFSITADTMVVNSEVAYTPSSDQSQANDSAITVTKRVMRVVGDGGAVVLDTSPSVNDGEYDGQEVVIQGTSDVNTVQITDNTNVQLDEDTAVTLGKGDTLHLLWDSGDSDWYELGRSDP